MISIKKTIIAIALPFVVSPFISFANTVSQIDHRTYSSKADELAIACKDKNLKSYTGFCVSREYGSESVNAIDTGQVSMNIALQAASLEFIYRSCERSDSPALSGVLEKAKGIFETRKFFNELSPQDAALKNYVGRFFPCKSKGENDETVSARLQWLNFMINKYGAFGSIASESRDAARAHIATTNFVVIRIGKECLSTIGRATPLSSFIATWEQRNGRYVGASDNYSIARYEEALAMVGAEKAKGIEAALQTTVLTNGESIVKSLLDRLDKVDACKRAISLIESGTYDFSPAMPMYNQLEDLVSWGRRKNNAK
jgi:hypothetical protein